ncbi:hypothetical protein GINT2_000667 [Glugoides intestinalis]
MSERKKTKIAIKSSRKQAKLNKDLRKKQKKAIKIPKSYLMTDEEKEHLKFIKQETENRCKEMGVPEPTDPDFIVELKKCVSEGCYDAFVEMVDFRDVELSRNAPCEKILQENGKKVYIAANFDENTFDIDFSTLENDTFKLLRDHSVLSNASKICIFGNPKTGKFLLSKSIEQINSNANFTLIETPVEKSGISALLRGYIGFESILPAILFEKCWKNIDQNAIKDFYMLCSFDSAESFLDLLAEKLAKESLKKKTHNDAALYFFKDILDKKIYWIKIKSQVYFDFGSNE